MMEGDPLSPDSSAIEPDTKDYNAVLEHYVEDRPDDLDLVGLIAYALYKRQKRDWIVAYRRKHNGSRPSDDEVAAVTSSYMTDDVRNTLRERAADILTSYADTYVDSLTASIQQNAINNETLRQAQAIEQSIRRNSGFWRQVGTGVIATAIWTAFLTALIIAAYAFGSDIIDGWLALRSE